MNNITIAQKYGIKPQYLSQVFVDKLNSKTKLDCSSFRPNHCFQNSMNVAAQLNGYIVLGFIIVDGDEFYHSWNLIDEQHLDLTYELYLQEKYPTNKHSVTYMDLLVLSIEEIQRMIMTHGSFFLSDLSSDRNYAYIFEAPLYDIDKLTVATAETDEEFEYVARKMGIIKEK
ncbi:hypothetical protein [Vibrio alfacsensis]|uniref:hypothetical protein n=1 Tax=Vibrio alfacsensis TaxID=1074311 RepID=UPI0040686BF9